MNWGSWGEFWSMGGRGLYVWGSYGVTLLCLLAEVWLLRARRRTLLRRLSLTAGAEMRAQQDETAA